MSREKSFETIHLTLLGQGIFRCRCYFSPWSIIQSFIEFQESHHGGHFGCRNGTILAILNLYVAPMPRIKFRLNLTYGLGGDVVWRISRRLLWRPPWISEGNDFSNSESLCHCDAFHQVLTQSDLRFGRRCLLDNFKMAALTAILDIGTEQF